MAIDPSAVARVIGIETIYKDLRGSNVLFLPQRVAVVAQGASASTYATTKQQVTSAGQAGTLYGFGSPIHLAVKELLPQNGDGVASIPVTVYPLEDDGAGVVAEGDITPSGSATALGSYQVSVNNILSEPFLIDVGATVAAICTAMTAAINAVLDIPIIATDSTTTVDVDAKWQGASGNDLALSVIGPSLGVTFAFTQPTGGLNNPDVDDGLNQVGNVWETMILNAMEIADTTTLEKYKVWGEGRWGELVRKPAVVFTGNTATTVAAATAVSSARTTDRVNAQLVAPGSNDLPFIVAARQLARIARVANQNPPKMYTGQVADGLTPGTDGDQWDFLQRDAAIKAGSSTIEVVDSEIQISNVVTFYAPTGEPIPAYRFVADIVKLQNIIFNLDLIFASADWAGAPLIPDNQPTVNRDAKKPSMAVAEVAAALDGLGLQAIISDPTTAKANTSAVIDSGNPKRLNVETTLQLAGNTNIINVTLNFGFFFGTATLAA